MSPTLTAAGDDGLLLRRDLTVLMCVQTAGVGEEREDEFPLRRSVKSERTGLRTRGGILPDSQGEPKKHNHAIIVADTHHLF